MCSFLPAIRNLHVMRVNSCYFFVKKCLTPIEIHRKMVNMLRDAMPSKTTICKWVLKFKRGRVRTDDDACREGSPKKVQSFQTLLKISYTMLIAIENR